MNQHYLPLLLIALVICAPLRVWAHGGEIERAGTTAKEAIPPALAGSQDFLKSLAQSGRGLFLDEQWAELDRAIHHLDSAEQIRKNAVAGATEIDADFNRWKAEESLCKVVNAVPNLVVLDYSKGKPAHNPDSPALDDPQNAIILFKVITGEGPTRFAVSTVDLVAERYKEHFTVTVEPAGTTYILLHLEQIPAAGCVEQITFARPGDTSASMVHAFTVPPFRQGQLRMEFLDETGKSTPVLLRITAKKSGKVWAPAGAADLRPMINDVTRLDIYGPERGYTVPIPGAFSGHYWVMPKAFEMALPPGEWEARIWHGTEYEPVLDTFSISENTWTKKTYTLKRWVKMADKGWYSGDDHVHSRLMSSEDADQLMAFTRAMDIGVSNILEMGDHMRTYYAQRGFGPDFQVQEDGHFLVPGQEDPRSLLGHNIGLNITGLARDLDRYMLIDWVADEVHKQGGLFGQTHVGENACNVHYGMAMMAPREIYDFYSVLQWRVGTTLYYDFLDLGYKLTASAGSDMPYGGMLGAVRLYAYTGNDAPFTPARWFDAVKKGHTFATNGPMLEFTVDDALPGDEIALDTDRPLTLKARAYGLPGESAPANLEIVQLSKVIQNVKSADTQTPELSVEMTIPAGKGFWIAARANGHNGSQSHTTPIYVTRNGFRHWNPERATGVIEAQMKVLDKIEEEIQASEKMAQGGTMHPADYWNRRIVDQAKAIRERLTTARNIYQSLLSALQEEQKQR